jgi:hypothetical protein
VSRTRLERGSARADNIHFFVGGMNPGFHVDYGILSSEVGADKSSEAECQAR